MTGWTIAAFAYLWFWGFVVTLTAIQNQMGHVGRTRMGSWHYVVGALWPISIPGVILGLIWDAARQQSKKGQG